MNRRIFLASLAAATAVSASGIELLELWQPKRVWFLPPRRSNEIVFDNELILISNPPRYAELGGLQTYLINPKYIPV